MLKLKLQYFDHLMRTADSYEKTLMLGRLKAGGEGDNRGWDGWRASSTWWTWVWVNSGSWWRTEKRVVLQSMGSQRVGHNWATELNWIEPSENSVYKLNRQWAKLSEIFIANFKVCWISVHLIMLLWFCSLYLFSQSGDESNYYQEQVK